MIYYDKNIKYIASVYFSLGMFLFYHYKKMFRNFFTKEIKK